MNMYPMAVEEEKPPEQRGTYLYSEAYGQPWPEGGDEVSPKMQALRDQEEALDQATLRADGNKAH